jgi:hypothetical protein
MVNYWIVWKRNLHPTDMYLTRCETKLDAIKIASCMEGILYTHAKKIKITNIENMSASILQPTIWLTYRKRHTYKKNYDDICVYYGTEQSAIEKSSRILDIYSKDIGIQQMDVCTLDCIKDSNEESDSSQKESDEEIVPDLITIAGTSIDVTNKEKINMIDLLDHLDCNNKYMILNFRSGEDSDPIGDNTILFRDNYTDFHDMVIKFCNYHTGCINVYYKSHSNSSCFVIIDNYEGRSFVEQYCIFGIRKVLQEKLRKMLKESLGEMESSCELQDY